MASFASFQFVALNSFSCLLHNTCSRWHCMLGQGACLDRPSCLFLTTAWLNNLIEWLKNYAPLIVLADETMYHRLGSDKWLLIMFYGNSFFAIQLCFNFYLLWIQLWTSILDLFDSLWDYRCHGDSVYWFVECQVLCLRVYTLLGTLYYCEQLC